MLFKYTGQMPDQVSFNETDYYFNPDSEIQLSDELVEFPYIARMVQNGLLKAVSRPAPEEVIADADAPEAEAEPEAEPEPEPATAPGAGTGSKTSPAPVQTKQDVK